ncbi:DNA recombination protein RmuC [Sandarakinorhabdus sp.]|uniref:DNA recombination protein RmuC n=1 Tax=Sandarakinorhabdus sp. TaxID=1916663 RepID=UPI00286E51F7|nr:DNA recombination protein RmuC [Sandarakinorhabdus sp.]
MTEILIAVAALLVGLGVGWWWASRPAAALREEAAQQREKNGRAAVEIEMQQKRVAELEGAERAREALASELAGLKAGQTERDRAHAAELARLQETFAALAGKALETAQTKLAESAEQLMTRQREAAGAGLEANRNQLAELIAPVKETLVKYETRLGEVEAARTEAYGSLKEQLANVVMGQEKVSGAAAKLETALRSSGKVAGRWGEEQCRNVLEAAGLVEGIDFETQWSVEGEDGRQRPDFKINLPGGRVLVIDVKCSIDAYVSAAESDDIAVRQTYLAAHARAVRTHADGLAKKDYAKAVGSAVEFVVLFVPGENFLGAALEHDRSLMNDFFKRQIVLAGPVNLVAVARTVGALRDQARLAKEAAEIAKLGRDLYDSLRIMGGNFAAVQRSLEGAVGNWNKLVGQADSRVMARARRFKDMGAATGLDDLSELMPVAQVPMLPTTPELATGTLPASDLDTA